MKLKVLNYYFQSHEVINWYFNMTHAGPSLEIIEKVKIGIANEKSGNVDKVLEVLYDKDNSCIPP